MILKNTFKSKSAWAGLASTLAGGALMYAGDNEAGGALMATGLTTIGLADRISRALNTLETILRGVLRVIEFIDAQEKKTTDQEGGK